MQIKQMLEAHPSQPPGVDLDLLARCIQACLECASTCTACADACLAEETAQELTSCIRTDQECAEICAATGRVLSGLSGVNRPIATVLVTACADACGVCAAECESHAQLHEHCRLCAEACRRCEQACRELLDTLSTQVPEMGATEVQ